MSSSFQDGITSQCLVYQVLGDIESWLGYAGTSHLWAFLTGVELRVIESGAEIYEWEIFGPLCQKEFYQPLIDRTGHPSLSMGWATALEFVNFKGSDSINQLIELIDSWHRTKRIDSISSMYPRQAIDKKGIEFHLGRLAKRPGMYTGDSGGWSFYCFLTGMIKGGNWLGVPELEGLEEVYRGIADRSVKSYGSEWAAFKIYRPGELLSWVNISPID